jgi:hypothetical protein
MNKIWNYIKNLWKSDKQNDLFKETKNDDEFRDQKWKQQQELDRILDKIQKRGYESLSKEEEAYLLKMKK